ncbi:MAG TPA: hypothetical protein VIJ75_14515 [Hanamia sp.]
MKAIYGCPDIGPMMRVVITGFLAHGCYLPIMDYYGLPGIGTFMVDISAGTGDIGPVMWDIMVG